MQISARIANNQYGTEEEGWKIHSIMEGINATAKEMKLYLSFKKVLSLNTSLLVRFYHNKITLSRIGNKINIIYLKGSYKIRRSEYEKGYFMGRAEGMLSDKNRKQKETEENTV